MSEWSQPEGGAQRANHIDVVTIFPEYLAPLDLSLIGRARAAGLLAVHVHGRSAFADHEEADAARAFRGNRVAGAEPTLLERAGNPLEVRVLKPLEEGYVLEKRDRCFSH